MWKPKKPDPDDVKRNARILATHPAWRLRPDGTVGASAANRRFHLVLLACLFIDMVLRDQVILVGAGYLHFKPAIMVVAGFAAILALWILGPVWKISRNALSVFFVTIGYAALMYFTVLYIGLSTVPKVFTRIATEQATLEATVTQVERRRSGRGDLHLHLFGRAKSYRLSVVEQPAIVPYMADSTLGYKVYPFLVGAEPIYFVGQRNWFGLRVERAAREPNAEPANG